jgi:hypothetical protein
MSKTNTVKSSHVRFGKRTFFFDVNVTAQGEKYLKITESKFVEEGKPRIYNSFILLPENVTEFQKGLFEAAVELKR